MSEIRFDVVITTYNRHDSLKVLVEQLLKTGSGLEHIIVVDSSAQEDQEIQKIPQVKYIKSSHGNQPYQRYLGYLSSQSDVLIYFDDDMRILDDQAFEKILAQFQREDVVAVQPNFVNQNEFLDDAVPRSRLNILKRFKRSFSLLKCLSGYCVPEEGKVSYCGIRGAKPHDLGYVECFNGGVFAVRRSALYQDFNFKLFDLFEKRMGMGEDTILGFSVAQQGNIVYLADAMFLHDDQKDSTYTVDFKSYGLRVSYSRLYLSLEYVRLLNRHPYWALLHYQWYMLWRVAGLGLNQLLSRKSSRADILEGYRTGWKQANKEYKELLVSVDDYWKNEAQGDI